MTGRSGAGGSSAGLGAGGGTGAGDAGALPAGCVVTGAAWDVAGFVGVVRGVTCRVRRGLVRCTALRAQLAR